MVSVLLVEFSPSSHINSFKQNVFFSSLSCTAILEKHLVLCETHSVLKDTNELIMIKNAFTFF